MTWTQRIAHTFRRGGTFSPEDVALAKQWGTCAYGECRIDGGEGEPINPKVKLLGTQFFNAVEDNQPGRAGRLLLEIQRLTLHLRKR